MQEQSQQEIEREEEVKNEHQQEETQEKVVKRRKFKLSSGSGTSCRMQVCLISHVLFMYFMNEK
jgi:hypothetical protein